MRDETVLRRRLWAIALLLGSIPLVARADGPSAPVSSPVPAARAVATEDPVVALERGLDFERSRNWASAVRHYEDALERWPSRSELSHRLRLCEMHLRLVRRYQDRSFRDVLIKLPRDRAMELYDELVDRIEHNWVDPVAIEPLVRRGLDNLEVALREPNFLKANATTTDPDRLDWLHQALRQRREMLRVPARPQARAEIAAACDLARQALGIAPAPVILEFVYGACDMLDPYSICLTPDKLDDMFSMIDGNFVGLGVELKTDERGLKIIGVIRGGPAAEAGLKAGDRIVAVDGRSIKGLGLDEAANLLQGVEGTSVRVSTVRADGVAVEIALIRKHVEVASVSQAKLVEPTTGVGYIQLIGFQKTSTDELDHAIRSLTAQGMRHLILDLRGNPGGLLNVAVDIADRFVDRGVIVSTRGRAPGQTQTYLARPDIVYTMPMSVLIDRESASASEILAGALKDLGRASIVGDRSYGKGSVQSIYELRSVNAGLKLTTAQFYSPTGRAYSEQGVAPDMPVRVAAKPVATDGPDDAPAFEIGNPAEDRALDMAIRQARQKTSFSR